VKVYLVSRSGQSLVLRLGILAAAAAAVAAGLPAGGGAQTGATPALTVPAFTAYCEPDPDGVRFSQRDGVSGWTSAKEKIVWFGEIKAAGAVRSEVRLGAAPGATGRLALTVTRVSGENLRPVPSLAYWTAGPDGSATARFEEISVQPGYHRFELQGVAKSGSDFGSPRELLVSGPAAVGAHFNLKERRNAASVHLGYPLAPKEAVTAFYNEVTVRTDPIWSYYMACGFQRGYFGIQVNSPTERRIIFSVWDSGNEGVDRNRVRPEDRVQLLERGEAVVASDFGNEGTGGHSHKVFSWRKDVTYRFLVTARPRDNATDYAAYFYGPERSAWELIARFRAPKDGQALRGLYSFNEDFVGGNGQLRRECEFGPQWVRTSDGAWHELTTARFTHDATGRSDRLDYDAGERAGRFFLANGGFRPGRVVYGQTLTRAAATRPPKDIPAEILDPK